MAKSKLTKDQVEHVARLAQLKLTSKEAVKFQKELSDILRHISQLEKLGTSRTSPTSQTPGLENIFRQDETRPSLSQKEALSGSKKAQRGYFKVKAVFEEVN